MRVEDRAFFMRFRIAQPPLLVGRSVGLLAGPMPFHPHGGAVMAQDEQVRPVAPARQHGGAGPIDPHVITHKVVRFQHRVDRRVLVGRQGEGLVDAPKIGHQNEGQRAVPADAATPHPLPDPDMDDRGQTDRVFEQVGGAAGQDDHAGAEMGVQGGVFAGKGFQQSGWVGSIEPSLRRWQFHQGLAQDRAGAIDPVARPWLPWMRSAGLIGLGAIETHSPDGAHEFNPGRVSEIRAVDRADPSFQDAFPDLVGFVQGLPDDQDRYFVLFGAGGLVPSEPILEPDFIG